MSSQNWYVYLISTGTRTYVGSTTNPTRRLRQHNGEIQGGARSTLRYRGQWGLVLYVSGFSDRSSACRWERIVKCRSRGLEGRSRALKQLVDGHCPSKGERSVTYTVPEELQLVEMCDV